MEKAAGSAIGEMNIMDYSGHKQLKWATGNPEQIAAAEEMFENLLGRGYSAFGSDKKGETKRLIDDFDPTMEEVVMVPRTVGG